MRNRNRKVDKARNVLGLPVHATAADARRTYRELAKVWHPDINAQEDAHAKMQEINQAYAFLMKEEFGVLDPWDEYDRWWWRQYGDDPIWGNRFPEDGKRTERPTKRKKWIGNDG
ncbi:MAG: Chaperone protein DnaJ [Syntrophaceae bacterium PtaU1.Bin231]|nr:MAG: Chaperone protein DnaJ [Syntrophaceae bacterium PtaU1.Bin231]